MPFGWLSDPLLQFAANISLALMLVIFVIIAVLGFDQARYVKIRRARQAAKSLFHQLEESPSDAPPEHLVTRARGLKKQITVYWIGQAYRYTREERVRSYTHFRSLELIYAPKELYQSKKSEDRATALELISLGKLDSESDFVKKELSTPGLSVFACQALMALNSRDGCAASVCAYRDGLITTSDLLRIMSEVTDPELKLASQSDMEFLRPLVSPYLRVFQ